MSVAYKPRLYTKVFVQFAMANLFTVSSFGIFFIFPLYLKDKGGTEADIGMIMGTFALSSVLCRPWISEIIDRLGRKRSYAAGAMLMGIIPLGYLLLRGDFGHIYGPLVLFKKPRTGGLGN